MSGQYTARWHEGPYRSGVVVVSSSREFAVARCDDDNGEPMCFFIRAGGLLEATGRERRYSVHPA